MGVISGRVAVSVVCLTMIASGAPPAGAQEGQALPEPSAASSAPASPAPDPAPQPDPAPVPAPKPKPAAPVAQVAHPAAAARSAPAPVATSSSRVQPVQTRAGARHQTSGARRRAAGHAATAVIAAPRPSFPRPVPASSAGAAKPHDDLGRRLTLAGLALLVLCTASAALLLSVVRLDRARPGA